MRLEIRAVLISIFVLVGAASIPVASHANADPLTEAILGSAADKAKDVIARAEAAGDAIAKSLGEQALRAIEALRVALAGSIGQTDDAVKARQTQLFNDVNTTLERLESDEKLVARDAAALTASWASTVKSLPFADRAPEVLMYEPRVITPEGAGAIPLSIVGPRLANADPVLASGTGAEVVISAPSDQELFATLDRKSFEFDEHEPTYKTIKLRFDQNVWSLLSPATWFGKDVVDRDITLMLLPKILANYRIEMSVNGTRTSQKTYEKVVGGAGKDGPFYPGVEVPPLDKDDGYVIDTDAILKNGLKFADIGGDSAQCVGLVADKLTKNLLVFHIQHGHITKWGEKKDSWVNCKLWIPLIKTIPTVDAVDPISGTLGWSQDVREKLPANLNDYTVTLSFFDGKEYILGADSRVPYGMVEIERGDQYIQFRPKPPIDF